MNGSKDESSSNSSATLTVHPKDIKSVIAIRPCTHHMPSPSLVRGECRENGKFRHRYNPFRGLATSDLNSIGSTPSFTIATFSPLDTAKIEGRNGPATPITMVAACMPSTPKGEGGRISVATIAMTRSSNNCDDGMSQLPKLKQHRVLKMQYSTNSNVSPHHPDNPSFCTVCIAAPNLTNSSKAAVGVLFALDTMGRLHACSLSWISHTNHVKEASGELLGSENDSDPLLDLRECWPSESSSMHGTSQSTDGIQDCPDLSFMNTLTARMEGLEDPDTSAPSAAHVGKRGDVDVGDDGNKPASNVGKTPPRNSKKRKKRTSSPASSSKSTTTSNISNAESQPTELKETLGTYIIASNLNDSTILPSEYPPIVMFLSPSLPTLDKNAPEKKKSRRRSTEKTENPGNNEPTSKHETPIITQKTSSPTQTMEWEGKSWCNIPGLEQVHDPMTCIYFVSRSRCGDAWKGILSILAILGGGGESNMEDAKMEQKNSSDGDDEGMIFMGFQDGSLFVSIVSRNPDFSLSVGRATLFYQLDRREPLISLQVIQHMPEVPSLLIFGSLGSVVGLVSTRSTCTKEKHMNDTFTFKFERIKPSFSEEGRWVSVTATVHSVCAGHEDGTVGDDSIDSSVGAGGSLNPKISSFRICLIVTTDSRRTFLYNINLPQSFDDGRRDSSIKESWMRYKWNKCKFPFSHCVNSMLANEVSSMSFSSERDLRDHHLANTSKYSESLMAFSTSSGKVVVLRMDLSTMCSQYFKNSNCFNSASSNTAKNINRRPHAQTHTQHSDRRGLISLLLRSKKESSHLEVNDNVIADTNAATSPLAVCRLLQSLESVMAKKERSQEISHFAAKTQQSRNSLKEIRESSRFISFVSNAISNNNNSSMPSLPLPLQCDIHSSTHIQPGVRRCVVKKQKLPLPRSSMTVWHPSVHVLQSLPHGLSPLLRSGSIHDMTAICYRRSSSGRGKPLKVLYGGTATSKSVEGLESLDDANDGMDKTGKESVSLDICAWDCLPTTIYGSVSMVYGNLFGRSITWHHSGKITDLSANTPNIGLKNTAHTASLNPSAAATRFCISNNTNRCSESALLGLVLPFDIGKKENRGIRLSFDILDSLTDVKSSNTETHLERDNSSPQSVAENIIQHWFQRQSTTTHACEEYLVPSVKEDWSIRQYSRRILPTIVGSPDSTVFCRSSVIPLMTSAISKMMIPKMEESSHHHDCCINVGFGPLAFSLRPQNKETRLGSEGELYALGYALGSSVMDQNDLLSHIPGVRHAIMKKIIEQQFHSKHNKGIKEEMKLLTLYQMVLSSKNTRKIAKHVGNSCEEILKGVDTGSEEIACPSSLAVSAISLYELMRSLQFTFM